MFTLKNSTQKNKRFVIDMGGMKHHFGSRNGKTFIDGRTDKEKLAWIARHNNDKGFNDKHSGIYYSRHLLWNNNTLKKNIDILEKKDNINIITTII